MPLQPTQGRKRSFKSGRAGKDQHQLETLIEDHHGNSNDDGTITYYLRTQSFNKRRKDWDNRLEKIVPVNVEVTGNEAESGEISYVPLNIRLTANRLRDILGNFQTTIIDIELARLPSRKVFSISKG